jgi:predicted Zn-dependent protease
MVVGDADEGWDEPPARTSIGTFSEVTPALGAAFGAAGAAGRQLFGYAEHEMRTTYLGTSAGLRRRHAQPTGSLLLNAKSRDLTRSAYLGLPTKDFTDVDLLSIHDTLAVQLGWAQRQIELPAGRYETLLPPAAVADLVGFGHWAGGSARDATDGQSVYSGPDGGTRIGAQLCGDGVRVTLRSDPNSPGLACAPFVMAHASTGLESVFDNGLALAPTEWIRDGVLATLIATRHTAARTGLPVAPYIDNLTMCLDRWQRRDAG